MLTKNLLQYLCGIPSRNNVTSEAGEERAQLDFSRNTMAGEEVQREEADPCSRADE